MVAAVSKGLFYAGFDLAFRSGDGTGGVAGDASSSPMSTLLDTMGLEDLCNKYNIALRQDFFMASLYLIIVSNLVLLILTLALQNVSCTKQAFLSTQIVYPLCVQYSTRRTVVCCAHFLSHTLKLMRQE